MRIVKYIALFAILWTVGIFVISGRSQVLEQDLRKYSPFVEDEKPASTLVKRVNWEEDNFFRFLYDLPQERDVAESSHRQIAGRASRQVATNRFNNALVERDKGLRAHDKAASPARDDQLASQHTLIAPRGRHAIEAHALRSQYPYESTRVLRESPSPSNSESGTASYLSKSSGHPQEQPPSLDKINTQDVHDRPSSSISDEQSFWDSEFSSFTSSSPPSSSHRRPLESSSQAEHDPTQAPSLASHLPSRIRLPPLLRASENRGEATLRQMQALADFEAPYILNSMDVADDRLGLHTSRERADTQKDSIASGSVHELTPSTFSSSKRSKTDSKSLRHSQSQDPDSYARSGLHAADADDSDLRMQFSNLFRQDESSPGEKVKKRRRTVSTAEEAAIEPDRKKKRGKNKPGSDREQESTKSKKVVLPQDPSYPEKVTKKWQLRAALTYYKHERAFKETNKIQSWLLSFDEFQQLSERGRQLYWSIKKARMPSERQLEARFARKAKRAAVREVSRGEVGTSRRQQGQKGDRNHVENDAALCQKLRHKISQIKLGRHYGSSWSIKDNEDLQELGEKELWKREMRTLRIALGKIRTIIEHTWSIDPRKLSKLDLNPMGKDPIEFIEEILPQAPE